MGRQRSNSKRGSTFDGPNFGSQPNLAAIEESLKEARRMSGSQRRAIIDVAPDEDDGMFDDDDGSSAPTKKLIPISEIPKKTPGGHNIHHCPSGKHSNENRCRAGGCIKPCPECSHWVSTYGGSKCLNCVNKAKAEMTQRLAELRIAREADEAAEAAELKEAENRKPRKLKSKWTHEHRVAAQQAEAEEHDWQQEVARRAQSAQVAKSGVKKRTGRTGAKGGVKSGSRSRSAGKSEDEVIIMAALVLYRYCEDFVCDIVDEAAEV